MKKRIVIGIDPDVDKSGVAVLDTETRALRMESATFGQLVSMLQSWSSLDAVIVVEAGWANAKATWHALPKDSKAVAAKKGLVVGRNQQIGHDIVELCKVYGLEVVEQPPFAKCWSGPDRKITHEELAYFTRIKDRTSNQEKRDAALLAWNYAGFPIKTITYKAK